MKKSILAMLTSTALLLANGPAAQPKADPGASMMIMMVLMFVILWFFMIRPEQKRQKQKDELRKQIGKGDKVITIGGICGTIVKELDDRVVIQTTKECQVTVLRIAVDRKDESAEKPAAEQESK